LILAFTHYPYDHSVFFLTLQLQPISNLFPYTTLFRSAIKRLDRRIWVKSILISLNNRKWKSVQTVVLSKNKHKSLLTKQEGGSKMDIQVKKVLDAKGLACPMQVVRAKKRIDE